MKKPKGRFKLVHYYTAVEFGEMSLTALGLALDFAVAALPLKEAATQGAVLERALAELHGDRLTTRTRQKDEDGMARASNGSFMGQ